MKAVVYNKYGPPEVLQLQDIEKPIPKPDEVLVKVFATSVTAGDWRMRKADPFLARLFNGLFKPRKVNILGFEIAGLIEEVGSKIASFKVGDEVFASCGFGFGGYAEYKCLPENDIIAIKPSNLTFEEAATVPIGCMTALAFLEKAKLKTGESVLIYGASGSVGTYATQLVKYHGAKVTGVCSSKNLELVENLGADGVVDYTKVNVTELEEKFDIVFDAVGKTSKSKCRKILKGNGRYVGVTGSAKHTKELLLKIRGIIEEGKLKPVIDRTYTLDQIQEAHAYVESFHKKGNVAIRVAT